MSDYILSVNQIADFLKSTDSKKIRIIKQQKYPNIIRVGWYQMPRARFKKVIELNGDLKPLEDAANLLNSRILEKPRQVLNRTVSLEAMQRFSKIKLPYLLKFPIEIIKKVESKTIEINGVQILVSPDVVFKINIDGEHYYGAVKIHISKNNIFDYKQSSCISSILFQYLKENFETENCRVNPELCLAIDVFGEKITSSPVDINDSMAQISLICEEVKYFWSAA